MTKTVEKTPDHTLSIAPKAVTEETKKQEPLVTMEAVVEKDQEYYLKRALDLCEEHPSAAIIIGTSGINSYTLVDAATLVQALWYDAPPRGGPPTVSSDGTHLGGDYRPFYYLGLKWKCHTARGNIDRLHLRKTTPAEAITMYSKLKMATTSPAMDNPPMVEAITKPLPGSSNFEGTWRALMDEGFPDDNGYF
ncbi:hypothetical protein HO173_000660 [Letharia columbiana]|uniref:Uncharacterized protein n=1 Tax=Letharia columbiana TaxID=112416 RepID=A0A8H6G5K8_9LECA|nr:uncharacterized protein HO173_000660 [Letharia columbiana]KAF6240868.1 hypothetical protein HO173_000660 [Letharia columbiana]